MLLWLFQVSGELSGEGRSSEHPLRCTAMGRLGRIGAYRGPMCAAADRRSTRPGSTMVRLSD